MRTSPIHYIDPTKLVITPNANANSNDIAVSFVSSWKTAIRVYSPRAGIDMQDNAFQEWQMQGKNRALTETSKPYTIYARLHKTNHGNGYLVFAPKIQIQEGSHAGEWIDKYPYVTKDGLSSDASEEPSSSHWYVRLGEVSAPVNDVRTVTFDTGILGTDQWNSEWALNPDALPLRIDMMYKMMNIVGEEWASTARYVRWDQILHVNAKLVEGWTGTDITRFHHWEITRNTGNPEADASWNAAHDSEPSQGGDAEVYTSTEVNLYLAHPRGQGDDFNGVMSSVFTFTAYEENPEYEDDHTQPQYLALVSESFSVLAEPVESYDLEASSETVTFNPQTGVYVPTIEYNEQTQQYSADSSVIIRVRAEDADGNTFYPTDEQIEALDMHVYLLPIDDPLDEENPPTELDLTNGRATLPSAPFLDGKGVNVWLQVGEWEPEVDNGGEGEVTDNNIVLSRKTITYIRNGVDGHSITKESEEYRYAVTIDTVQPTQDGSSTGDAELAKWYEDKNRVLPLWTAGRYLWTKTIITWSDESTTNLYSSERNPNDGQAGQDIVVDGSTVMKYAVSESNAIRPTTWHDYNDIKSSIVPGKWLWSQAMTYYRKSGSAAGSHDAGSSANYNVSYIGDNGTDAQYIYLKGSARDIDSTITDIVMPIVNVNGGTNLIVTTSRGLNLVTINRQTLEMVESINYDTYGEAASDPQSINNGITLLLAKLNSLDDSVFVCLVSFDAIGWSNALIAALQGYGMSDLPYTQTGRYPFLFIGYKNLGKDNGLTRMRNTGAYTDVVELSAYVANGALTARDGKDGKDGADGRSITSITEYYKASNLDGSDVQHSETAPSDDSGWDTDPNLSHLPAASRWNEANKYLWNYEKITYSSGTLVERTTPQILAIWTKDGAAGKGIDSIQNMYVVSDSDQAPPRAHEQGGSAYNWTSTPQAPGQGEYLWNYEIITWINPAGTTYTDVQQIGYAGTDGEDGDDGADAIVYKIEFTDKTFALDPNTGKNVISIKGAVYKTEGSTTTKVTSLTTSMFAMRFIDSNGNIRELSSAYNDFGIQNGEFVTRFGNGEETDYRTFVVDFKPDGTNIVAQNSLSLTVYGEKGMDAIRGYADYLYSHDDAGNPRPAASASLLGKIDLLSYNSSSQNRIAVCEASDSEYVWKGYGENDYPDGTIFVCRLDNHLYRASATGWVDEGRFKGDNAVVYKIDFTDSTFAYNPNTTRNVVDVKGIVYKTDGGNTSVFTSLGTNSTLEMYFLLEDGTSEQIPANLITISNGSFSTTNRNGAVSRGEKNVLAIVKIGTSPNDVEVTRANITRTVYATDGSRGKRGRSYYYAQPWEDDSVAYTVNDSVAPYFLYNNEYYVYNPIADVDGSVSMHDMGTPDTTNPNWEQIQNDFKYIITEAIFGSFAHFGSAIISGDWMISQHGTINGVNSTNYTAFNPEHPNDNIGTNFIPNYAVDLLTGATYQQDTHITGGVFVDKVSKVMCQTWIPGAWGGGATADPKNYNLYTVTEGEHLYECDYVGSSAVHRDYYSVGKVSLKSNNFFILASGINDSLTSGSYPAGTAPLRIRLPEPKYCIGQTIVITNKSTGFPSGSLILEQEYVHYNGPGPRHDGKGGTSEHYVCMTAKEFLKDYPLYPNYPSVIEIGNPYKWNTDPETKEGKLPDDWTFKDGEPVLEDSSAWTVQEDENYQKMYQHSIGGNISINGIWLVGNNNYPIVLTELDLTNYEWIELVAVGWNIISKDVEPTILNTYFSDFYTQWMVTRWKEKSNS